MAEMTTAETESYNLLINKWGFKTRNMLKGIMNEHALQLKNMNRSWKETAGAMGDWFNRYQAFAVAAVASIVGVVMAFRKTS